MIITTVDATGEPLNIVQLPDESHVVMNTPTGGGYVIGESPANSYYLNDAWVTKPDQPSIYCVWDKIAKAWVDPRTLEQVKAIQIAVLQAAYQAAINAPVSFTNAAGVASTYPAGDVASLNGKTAAQNLANCITPGATAWTMGKWLDTANVAQAFTYADLQGLAAAMESVEVLDWQDLVLKVAEVHAATTIQEAESIVF